MKIKCGSCGHSEKTNLGFFVKVIGGAMPIGGYWAWVAYLFAGTGFAMPIVVAIIAGGTAMLVFKDEIVQWIVNRGYKCPKCGKIRWEA
jgi:ribosomal protein S27AE